MTEPLSKDTFEIYRDYIDSKFHESECHFETLHECDKRIEQKIDHLATKLESGIDKKEERKFGRETKILMAIIALGSSAFMWLISKLSGQ